MKISAKKYAEVLYETVFDKNKDETRKIIEKFVKVLAKNRNISYVDNIIKHFESIWNNNNSIVDAEVKFSHEPNKESVSQIERYLKEITGVRNVNIFKKIDQKLLGGVVIKYGDKVLDGSLRTRLALLKDKLTK